MPTTEQTTPATRARMSPRRRAQLLRWVQYAVLAIVLLVAVFAANWHQIIDVFFRGNLVVETLTTSLGTAFKNTLVYTAGAFAFGLVVGTVLALMRLSSVAPYRWIAGIYIEFFRGLPAIVVLIAFSLLPLAFPGMVIPLDPYGTVWIALGIVASAYMAETIRAGIQAVPKGQLEAARRLEISLNRLNEIVLGKRGITADTALRLARLLKTSPQFWMRLQADWDLHQAMARAVKAS